MIILEKNFPSFGKSQNCSESSSVVQSVGLALSTFKKYAACGQTPTSNSGSKKLHNIHGRCFSVFTIDFGQAKVTACHFADFKTCSEEKYMFKL